MQQPILVPGGAGFLGSHLCERLLAGGARVIALDDFSTGHPRSRSRLVHTALPADDPKRRCPDISRAKRHLQWQPKVALEDGLKETINWFRRRLGTAPRVIGPLLVRAGARA